MASSGSWDKSIAKFVTPVGGSQAGFQSKLGVTKRPKKSYVHLRERQILRQVATRLYFGAKQRAIKKDLDTPVEVQMMYTGGNVFVGSNLYSTAESLHKILSSQRRTENTLIKDSFFKTKTSIGGRTTDRHGKKLSERMYNGKMRKKWTGGPFVDLASRKRATHIADIIKDIQPEYIDPSDKKQVAAAFGKQGHIYVLHGGGNGRHVEEKFTDMIESAKHTGKTYIGGKMRPCLTCSGRMTHSNQQGSDLDFSEFPGRVWKSRFEAQASDVRAVTTNLAKTKPSHVSKFGGSGYGSGSDSD